MSDFSAPDSSAPDASGEDDASATLIAAVPLPGGGAIGVSDDGEVVE